MKCPLGLRRLCFDVPLVAFRLRAWPETGQVYRYENFGFGCLKLNGFRPGRPKKAEKVRAPRMQEFADEVGEVLQAIGSSTHMPSCLDLDLEEILSK